MKKYKRVLYQTKWSFLLPFYLLKNSAFRKLYFNTYLSTRSLQTFQTILRKLLRLNPRWSYGHYLLGLVSFRLFQNSNDGGSKGTLRLSMEAIQTLAPQPSEKDLSQKTLLECLLLFLNKKYQVILDSTLLEPARNSTLWLNDAEKALLYEVLGFSNLIMGKDIEAKHSFILIPPYVRTGEISAAITNLERSLNT